MNLLKGFTMRSDRMRHEPATQEIGQFEFRGSDLSGEMTLEDMLADPVVRSLMKRDEVTPAEIVRVVSAGHRAPA